MVDQIPYTKFIGYIKKFTKRKEIIDAIETIWYLGHHKSQIANMRLKFFDSELSECHKKMKLQTDSVLELVSGIEKMFQGFEEEHLHPILRTPLKDVIKSFKLLQQEESRTNLDYFLKEFTILLPKLEYVVKVLDTSLGTSDTSLLQHKFKKEMQSFVKSCLESRNRLEAEISEEIDRRQLKENELSEFMTKKR